MFKKFGQFIQGYNYRPLVLSKTQVLAILSDTVNVCEWIGFYAVTLKTPGISKRILTLRYALFDSNFKGYNLDGKPVNNIDSSKLKHNGFKVCPDGKTSFYMTRDNVERIFLNGSPFAETDQFVIFIMSEVPEEPLTFQLRYAVTTQYEQGGGAGPGSTSTNPPPRSGI